MSCPNCTAIAQAAKEYVKAYEDVITAYEIAFVNASRALEASGKMVRRRKKVLAAKKEAFLQSLE